MSSTIFREHKTVADRSASDKRRHKQKIERAIIVAVKVRGNGLNDDWTLQQRLEELNNLTISSGAEVVDEFVQTINKNSSTFNLL